MDKDEKYRQYILIFILLGLCYVFYNIFFRDTSEIDNQKIILSGGINIKNVDNAIDINPWCIDINSGVESSPGLKDIYLTNKLIEKI